jgi:hypothetical protein
VAPWSERVCDVVWSGTLGAARWCPRSHDSVVPRVGARVEQRSKQKSNHFHFVGKQSWLVGVQFFVVRCGPLRCSNRRERLAGVFSSKNLILLQGLTERFAGRVADEYAGTDPISSTAQAVSVFGHYHTTSPTAWCLCAAVTPFSSSNATTKGPRWRFLLFQELSLF